ncbi:MAG TPA: cytochrome c [Candidatus Sulfopaludibacter sp.]|nr:cytochrome c [Candidatus Sulfopaludibacter sp.]
MSRPATVLVILAFLMAAVACSTARDPGRGFRLAGNGDIARGKAAFVEFGCNLCHNVQGSNLPRAAVQPVVLGGSVAALHSDGYLVTAIINPEYHAVLYPDPNKRPRMPAFANRMTVQQLTDIVAYLQSRYALEPLPVRNEYP